MDDTLLWLIKRINLGYITYFAVSRSFFLKIIQFKEAVEYWNDQVAKKYPKKGWLVKGKWMLCALVSMSELQSQNFDALFYINTKRNWKFVLWEISLSLHLRPWHFLILSFYRIYVLEECRLLSLLQHRSTPLIAANQLGLCDGIEKVSIFNCSK